AALADDPRRKILVTLHRRENLGEPMRHVCQAIQILLHRFPDVLVIFPWHLNPEVRKVVSAELGEHPRALLVEPLEYAPLVHLMKLSTLVLTDSGGIQEEAPSLGKPVLVARETTERPEGIEAGSARLVGTTTSVIVDNVTELLTQPDVYDAMSHTQNPYGDGQAAGRICDHVLHFLNL
ncbi:MAG: UDP-N-acetylglucosamine 2-epimerase (non-hydrolyzing), partial [Armatimonadota bacterium]|nr:UDP-N-acetylglucosamine 2-epimerase (non-hydrolyzing) [Armatimonadota bacterium]